MRDRLRIAYLANVTHEVALTARARGSFEKALAPLPVEWQAFGAGPQVIEALFAGAVDVAYLGPGPAEIGFVRSGGEALAIVSGAASGGAALVVRHGIDRPDQLHGARLASPQIGNTQDVALRTWLAAQGLRTADLGGDVSVYPLRSSVVRSLMQRGDLDGAWVPQPWVASLVHQAGAHVLVDERTLWPEGRFPTTVLVATREALRDRADVVARLVAAHSAEVAWCRAHPDEARDLVAKELLATTGLRLPPAVLVDSLADIEPTDDPMPARLDDMARQAARLGYLPAFERPVDFIAPGFGPGSAPELAKRPTAP